VSKPGWAVARHAIFVRPGVQVWMLNVRL